MYATHFCFYHSSCHFAGSAAFWSCSLSFILIICNNNRNSNHNTGYYCFWCGSLNMAHRSNQSSVKCVTGKNPVREVVRICFCRCCKTLLRFECVIFFCYRPFRWAMLPISNEIILNAENEHSQGNFRIAPKRLINAKSLTLSFEQKQPSIIQHNSHSSKNQFPIKQHSTNQNRWRTFQMANKIRASKKAWGHEINIIDVLRNYLCTVKSQK